jgi:hypothetical protein
MIPKKMMLSFVYFLAFISLVGCSGKPFHNPKDEGIDVPQQPTMQSAGRQKTDFDFLKPGISYNEIVAKVGKEDRDIGFGLYILEYTLGDGSRIYLQFSSLESLDRAFIVYSDGKEEVIAGP